jgi:exodeoxyribonuclease VIII
MTNPKTRQEYDSVKALNYSGMKHLLRSPRHYIEYVNAESKDSKALRVGRMVHEAVLQPDVFSKYVIAPDVKRNTKEGKAVYEAFLSTLAADATIADSEEMELAVNVSNSIKALMQRQNIVMIESEAMFLSEDSGVPLKCSIDMIAEDGFIYDLKTTDEATPRAFLRTVLQFKYHLQAYVYSTIYERERAIRPKGFRFIVVEKEPPFEAAIFQLGPELNTDAVFLYEQCLKTFKSCQAMDSWPGYPTEVQMVDLQPKGGNSTPINFA